MRHGASGDNGEGRSAVAVKVGFIGLGIMGSRMAANLQAQGYPLVVFNRTRAAADALLRLGAIWRESPAQVAAGIDMLVTMLPHPEAVASAASGADGFLGALRAGSIWINCGTMNPSFARRMAEVARATGVRYLDAPVTGSRDAAAHGELMFLVGGDASDLEACRPLLMCMGDRIVHVGGHGLGSALKMVNNLLGAVAMAAFSEGTALGEALGVPRKTIFDTLIGGPMAAPLLAAKRGKIERADYDPEFSLQWIQKDLHLASISAYEAGMAMPVVNVTKELYRLAMRHGYADLDYSALYAFVNSTASADAKTAPAAAAGSHTR
jgi:3-hydroxyisobutyrate dehydrogenase/glyoxylate/succinic semialdehyde reductase